MAPKKSAAERVDRSTVRSALESLATQVPPAALIELVEEFLDELTLAHKPPAMRTKLEQSLGRKAAALALRPSMHEMRSLLLAVNANLIVGRELLLEVLARTVMRNGEDVQKVVELQDALEDALAASEQAVLVAKDGLDSTTAPTHSHAPLKSCAELAARLMTRGQGRTAPVEVFDIPDVTVRPSRGEVMQVLLNIIRNAQVAVSDSTVRRVAVDGWASLTMAFLRVSDTGPGFKSEVQDDREVYSVDRITPEVGHGLGLLICREMVERWGG
ncbi:MAG: HAMP domain-containing histidine kinase, partial [Myxococcales bacterium]|nr:HAMP domain-containing histidine kinase [Myxococcales bacterium]